MSPTWNNLSDSRSPSGLPKGNRMPKAPPLLPLAQWSCRQILKYSVFGLSPSFGAPVLFRALPLFLLQIFPRVCAPGVIKIKKLHFPCANGWRVFAICEFNRSHGSCFAKLWLGGFTCGDWGSGGELTTKFGRSAFLFSVKTVRHKRKTVICTRKSAVLVYTAVINNTTLTR